MQEESKTLQNAAKLLPLDSGEHVEQWPRGLILLTVCAVRMSAFVFQHVI